MNLWLDDERDPAKFGHTGWTWAKSVEEAIGLIESSAGVWEAASLDHDLGECENCALLGQECRHVKNGYDFVLWMIEHNKWPVKKPSTHSTNPVGKAAMDLAINRWFGRAVTGEDL